MVPGGVSDVKARHASLGKIAHDLPPIVRFNEAVRSGALIFVQKVAMAGGLGPGNLTGRQVVKDRCLFRHDLSAVFVKSAVQLHRSQTDQPQRFGPVPGLQREGRLGLGIAVLDVLRDCRTAGQSGVSSHGLKPLHCNTSQSQSTEFPKQLQEISEFSMLWE